MKVDLPKSENYQSWAIEEQKISDINFETPRISKFDKNISDCKNQTAIETDWKINFQNNIIDSTNRNEEKDKQGIMNYLNLIQDVQRKRKFNEICPIIRSNTFNAQNDKPLSRRERLLHEIHQNSEVPGKVKLENSKLKMLYPSILSNDDFHDISLNSSDDWFKHVKRVMMPEIENDSEFYQTVSMEQARIERAKYQQNSSQNQ